MENNYPYDESQTEEQEQPLNDDLPEEQPVDDPSQEPEAPLSPEEKYNRLYPAIVSLITAAVPFFIWTSSIRTSGGSLSESGEGAVWWFVIMYYISLGFPLAIISFVFGFIGLKTRFYWLATIALLIKVITISIAVMFFIQKS